MIKDFISPIKSLIKKGFGFNYSAHTVIPIQINLHVIGHFIYSGIISSRVLCMYNNLYYLSLSQFHFSHNSGWCNMFTRSRLIRTFKYTAFNVNIPLNVDFKELCEMANNILQLNNKLYKDDANGTSWRLRGSRCRPCNSTVPGLSLDRELFCCMSSLLSLP